MNHSWRLTQIVANLFTLPESVSRWVGPIVEPQRPTRPVPTHPGHGKPRTGRGRTRSNRPTPARNPPIALKPAKSQQTDAAWSDSPGSREAGSHKLQGIGPYNGRRFGPASGSGRSKTETASLQPGSRSTTSNPASSAEWKPRRADRVEIRNPLAIASKPQRFSRRNRQQRNREAIATRGPAPGSREADAIQACGTGTLDERVSWPMAGRPSPCIEISNPLGREPESVQIPMISSEREG